MISNAVDEAKQECRSIADNWKKETDALEKKAQTNLKKAKEFILHSVLD